MPRAPIGSNAAFSAEFSYTGTEPGIEQHPPSQDGVGPRNPSGLRRSNPQTGANIPPRGGVEATGRSTQAARSAGSGGPETGEPVCGKTGRKAVPVKRPESPGYHCESSRRRRRGKVARPNRLQHIVRCVLYTKNPEATANLRIRHARRHVL